MKIFLKSEFECRVITNLIMTGYDRRNWELRTQEFKGIIRFWWRAAHATKSIQLLKAIESTVFGGSSQSLQRSKVQIRISPKQEEIFRGNEEVSINEKPTFCLELISYDDSALKQALAAFWLASFLGGFGRRSRRFSGNICISDFRTDLEDGVGLEFTIPKLSSSQELREWLLNNSKKAIQIIQSYSKIKKDKDIDTHMVGFSNVFYLLENPNTKDLIISKVHFKNPKEAIEDLREKYKTIIDSYFSQNKEAILGLPLLKENKQGRRASPFIFKVIATYDHENQERYYWMVVRLHGRFFKDEENPKNYKFLQIQNEFVEELNKMEAKS